MSYGDDLNDLFDLDAHVEQHGDLSVISVDTDGNGQDDTAVIVDPTTGEYALHAVNEDDGSTVTLMYDAAGSVIAAAFADPAGAITEVTGPDVVGFLTELETYTGCDVPFEVPVDPTDLPDDGFDGFDLLPYDTVISQVPIDPDADTYDSLDDIRSAPGYEDWAASRPDSVIGDVSDADFWFQQGTDFTCAPSAATQIVEDFTGADLGDETEIARWAAEHGYLTEADGMYPEGLAATLTHFGVPASVHKDQDWGDIAEYLAEGRSVVMMVDAGDYWPGNDDDAVENADDDTIDHAVRIVAIDTERGVAVLSDSGAAYGQMLEVPLDAMEEAWNDVTGTNPDGTAERGRVLVVSDSPDPTDDDAPSGSTLADFGSFEPAAVEPAVEPGDVPSTGGSPLADFGVTDEVPTADGTGWVGEIFSNPAGWVLVPVTLAASRIFATRA